MRRARADAAGDLDVARQQRVHPRRLVGDAEQLDLVEIGLARLPVVFVADADTTDAGGELLALVGPGADRGGEIGGAILDDQEVERSDHDREIRIRGRQRHLHLIRRGRLHLLHLRGQRPGDGGDLRVLVAQKRIHHVGGGQRFAVVERHAVAQLEGPYRCFVVADLGGELGLRGQAFIQPRQPVVEHLAALVVGRQRLLGRIEGVGGGGGEAGHTDMPAALRRLG